MKGEKASIVFGSDLLRDDFGPIVKGHAVNGVPLCTPVSSLSDLRVRIEMLIPL